MSTIANELSLLEHMRTNLDNIPEEMLYKQAAIAQMIFFRDKVAAMFSPRGEDINYESRQHFCRIAGFHHSKSIDLPVYHFQTDKIEVVARENFYNWNCTVISQVPLVLPEYFKIDSGIDYLFMEGMDNWRRGTYAENQSEFSFCKWTDEEFWAIMWCISSQVKE